MKKLTKHTRPLVGQTFTIKWGTSRGRDSYGYTTCSLSQNGRTVARCNGGGYDMFGTVVGDWITRTLAPALLTLKAEAMPAHSHWNPERARCCAGACEEAARKSFFESEDRKRLDLPKLPEDCWTCPKCGGDTRASRDGQTVQDGRYFYGLTFHDPNFDPAKAVIGKDCSDRTLGDGAAGQTVGAAEAEGKSFGLERYQAIYSASSKTPTRRHRVPSIDGACGYSSVIEIIRALGLDLRRLDDCRRRSSGPEIYEVVRC